MSRGKYSLAYEDKPDGFNARGQTPVPFCPYQNKLSNEHYVLSCSHFDEEGYDRYGYSCYDNEGNFVGDGNGVDRAGWTEMDYLTLQDIPEEHRESYYYYNS